MNKEERKPSHNIAMVAQSLHAEAARHHCSGVMRNTGSGQNQRRLAMWIKCSDRLPNKGQSVLCFYETALHHHIDPHGRSDWMVVRQLITDDGYRWADEGVTHWMPLPAPPTAENNGAEPVQSHNIPITQ